LRITGRLLEDCWKIAERERERVVNLLFEDYWKIVGRLLEDC